MSRNASLEEKRLPQAEWDFGPAIEKAKQHKDPNETVTTVLYYEYLRSSKTWAAIRNIYLRALELSELERMGQRDSTDPEVIEADHDYRKIISHEFGALLQEMDRKTKHNTVQPFAITSEELTGGYSLGTAEKKASLYDYDRVFPVTEKTEEDVKEHYRKRIISIQSERSEIETLVRWGIDWRFTDAELLEAFSDFLQVNRPQNMRNPKPLKEAGFSHSNPYPLKSSKAYRLECLGVWRRKNRCTWSEYIRLYHPNKDPSDHYLKRTLQRTVKTQRKCLYG